MIEPTPAITSRSLENPLEEALRIIDAAAKAGVTVRLMGGLAFHARAPEWTARIPRARRDIDLATYSRDRRRLTGLLTQLGYEGDRRYNALHSHKQLYFIDPTRDRPMDVLIDKLEMCHTFSFSGRLEIDYPTLPLADLLLSKLQIVRINRKDVLDALVLLGEHPLVDDDKAGISVPRILDLTSTDWGWWRTVSENLGKLRAFMDKDVQAGDLDFSGRLLRFDAAAQAGQLSASIDAAPKSTRWKLRARVGDRLPWYQQPEEVGRPGS